MNLLPKANPWLSKTVQVMRISSSGPVGPIQAGGSTLEQKPLEVKKSSDSSKANEPTEAPKSSSPYGSDPPTLEVPANDPLFIMHEQKVRDHPNSVVNKDIVEHLKSYFDDQIVYYKTMANYNKSAMKRIKKIKKKWNKMLD